VKLYFSRRVQYDAGIRLGFVITPRDASHRCTVDEPYGTMVCPRSLFTASRCCFFGALRIPAPRLGLRQSAEAVPLSRAWSCRSLFADPARFTICLFTAAPILLRYNLPFGDEAFWSRRCTVSLAYTVPSHDGRVVVALPCRGSVKFSLRAGSRFLPALCWI